jgi:CubicO group peptidase (beta-lactamase class C family)
LTRPKPLPSAVAVALVALVLLASVGATARTGSNTSDQIDAFINDRLEANGIPAATVAVVRGGEVLHLGSYGVADDAGTPVTAETPFLIGSVSKPFTGVAVYQLIADGELSADEPIRPYVEAASGEAAPAFEGITVDHLINHASGLPQPLALPGSVPVRTGPDALQLRVADIADRHTRTVEPGDQYEYSNANYILLAWIVEQVSGEPFAEYIHRHVFEPLGMDASFATDAHASARHLVPGHERWFGIWREADHPYDPAGVAMGYMGSTARDMAAFLTAELSEGHSALPFTAAEIAPLDPEPTGWDVPLETGIARGWFIDEVAGHRTVSHAGSLGNYTAHLIMIPDADGLGIAVLQNASAFIAAGHEGQYDLSLGLVELLLGLDPQPRDPSPLLTLVVPLLAWGVGVGVIVLAARFLIRRRRTAGGDLGRRWWPRAILPSAVYATLALTVLVLAPMLMGVSWASAQLFYPDMAWGMVLSGYVALAWAIGRLVLPICPRWSNG